MGWKGHSSVVILLFELNWRSICIIFNMPKEIWLLSLFLHSYFTITFIKNSSTMASNNRSELQQHLSVPIGHSKADRDGGIAFLLVQLAKDIAIIREASNSTPVQALIDLKGIDSITGTKARIKELKQTTIDGLALIEHGVDQILSLTNTLKELILHLEPYKGQGLKNAVEQLNNEGRCIVSGSSFIRHMKK